jgi:hypothetical protein
LASALLEPIRRIVIIGRHKLITPNWGFQSNKFIVMAVTFWMFGFGLFFLSIARKTPCATNNQ